MTSNAGSGAATLGEMLFANEQAARAAAAEATSKPAAVAPVIPATPSEAAARLKAAALDPKWLEEYFGGSVIHANEMRDLKAVIGKDADPQTEMAIAGQLYDGIQPAGHLAKVGTAEMLRAVGADDGVVRQVLTGQSVSQQEFDAAQATKARLMKDNDFISKYNSGDGESRRTLTLLNVVLTSPVKKDAAA
jgi:hypothetical protein